MHGQGQSSLGKFNNHELEYSKSYVKIVGSEYSYTKFIYDGRDGEDIDYLYSASVNMDMVISGGERVYLKFNFTIHIDGNSGGYGYGPLVRGVDYENLLNIDIQTAFDSNNPTEKTFYKFEYGRKNASVQDPLSIKMHSDILIGSDTDFNNFAFNIILGIKLSNGTLSEINTGFYNHSNLLFNVLSENTDSLLDFPKVLFGSILLVGIITRKKNRV